MTPEVTTTKRVDLPGIPMTLSTLRAALDAAEAEGVTDDWQISVTATSTTLGRFSVTTRMSLSFIREAAS